MASDLPEHLLQATRLIKRRYVQIPGDQKRLLEEESSWSENLNRGQLGMLNVPSQVLQDIKDFHARGHAVAKHQDRRSSLDPSSTHNTVAAPKPSRPQQPAPSPVNDDESDGMQVPWSPTPLPGVDGHTAQESVKFGSSQKRGHRRSPPITQPKRKNSPLFIQDDPASSGAYSEGLEVDPPAFLSQEMEPPVNRAALQAIATASGRPEPTPPSAQMLLGTGESVIQPPAKRRRRMDEIRFSGDVTEQAESTAVPNASPKPFGGKPGSCENGLTTSASTNSYGSQSARPQATQAGTPGIRSDPGTYQHSSFTPTWEGRRQAHVPQTGPTIPGPSFVPPPAQQTAGHRESPNATSAQPAPQEDQPPPTPYEAFRAAYPDYSESCTKFVGACLSVKQLRRALQLPEFAYDDYVRAHSSEYLLYVSECDRKTVKSILPGIEWYNKTTKNLQYTKKLIRGDNLAAILEAHAKEAHSVRRTIGDSQSTASESAEEGSDEDMEDAPGEDEQEGEKPEALELDADEGPPAASPELHIDSPGLLPVSVTTKAVRADGPTNNDGFLDGRLSSPIALSVGQVDATMEDAPELEEQDHDDAEDARSVVAANEVICSAEASIEPSRPAKTTSTPNGHDVVTKQRTPAPVRLQVSQRNSRGSRSPADADELLRPIQPSTPVQKTKPPSTEKAARGLRASKTQPVDYDDSSEDAFESLVEETMPPPPKTKLQSSPAPQPRAASAATAQPADKAAAPVVSKSTPARKTVIEPQKAVSRASNASSLSLGAGRSHSSGPSEKSYANGSRSTRRRSETPAERSRNFKAFMKKRLSSRTPSSTAVSKK